MTGRPRSPDDDSLPVGDGKLDALWVHGLLRGMAEPADTRDARLARFVDCLRQEPDATRGWCLTRRTLVGAALAASVLMGAPVILFESRPARAGAELLLRRAQDAHRLPVDRCYRVQWESQPGLETVSSPSETYLWTRGDRFWMKIHGRRLACGRDERGGIWVARTRQVGIRFDPAEAVVPKELAITCAVCTMQLETLLGDVLRDFDLKSESPRRDADGWVDTIRATLKPGREQASVKAALLEIDGQTHVVRRLVLDRNETTVTYTLVKTGKLDEDQYKLEGHLEPDARIYTGLMNPELRQQKLRELSDD